jgi:hypothetical protein
MGKSWLNFHNEQPSDDEGVMYPRAKKSSQTCAILPDNSAEGAEKESTTEERSSATFASLRWKGSAQHSKFQPPPRIDQHLNNVFCELQRGIDGKAKGPGFAARREGANGDVTPRA